MTSALGRVPALARGVRLEANAWRGWVLASRERRMIVNDRAAAAIRLIDGMRSVAEIACALRKTYAGGIDTLEADVLVLVRVLLGRGLVLLRTPVAAAAP